MMQHAGISPAAACRQWQPPNANPDSSAGLPGEPLHCRGAVLRNAPRNLTQRLRFWEIRPCCGGRRAQSSLLQDAAGLAPKEETLMKERSAGIPASSLEDRAGRSLQKNSSYIFLSLLQQIERSPLSALMEPGYLKEDIPIQD